MRTHLFLAAAALALPATAFAAATPHTGAHEHHADPPDPAPAPPAKTDHTGHGAQAMPPPAQSPVPPEGHGIHGGPRSAEVGGGYAMSGALGPYPISRDASGTAWQPDASSHGGVHASAGKWMLMAHGVLNLVYDWQEGPRGDEKVFASGMLMGVARRDFAGGDTLQFKAMISPDPLMGKRGYPLHLASGETANGVDLLIDRQHPHDFFMELSASYSLRLSDRASAFIYAGLPGEPAFGPPAFMHRLSIMDSPEAPITHHWLDSTHITFGVVTAGLVLGSVKVEASRFNGREPDEERYDIESGPLDSTAVRLSFNPTDELSFQASWAHLESPEQLAPGEDQTRWSASGIYTRPLGNGDWWSTTLSWGRRSGDHEHFDALAFESAVRLDDWTMFGRAEYAENNELLSVGGHHGPAFKVGKASVGAVRDLRVAKNVKLGVGGLFSLNFVPNGLEGFYGGDPHGAMGFVRLKIE